MILLKPVFLSFVIALVLYSSPAFSQSCTTLGQTPSTAFPVCGTTTFQQNNVPICSTNDLFVPGCSGPGGADYENKNPFFYKFTCYVGGTLGFLITPNDLGDDYDWQLYDITGHNPNDIFTNNTLVVTGNWAGTFGLTGASATGVTYLQCASIPEDNEPTFSAMPVLIAGHQYLLMISHFTDSQSGYALSFGGGSGVITDPLKPHMQNVKVFCDGKLLTLKLNKKVRCSTLTSSGSEFSISPAVATVVSANAPTCGVLFETDSIEIQLSNPVPPGTYQLVINKGGDGNTLLDFCDNVIPDAEQSPFTYTIPQPTPFDSIGKVGCKPDEVIVYFSKKIQCSSIAADGSDFTITGPTPVTVVGASGDCVNDKSPVIHVKLSQPIYTGGMYTLHLNPGSDGSTVIDECGRETLPQTGTFLAVDTVSPRYTYTEKLGCRLDTFTFLHDGAHGVTRWAWTFNNTIYSNSQNYTIIFPATSTNTIKLWVTNGVCTDSATTTLELSNEVKAQFEMDEAICPGDPAIVTNTSKGLIDSYLWKYDIFGTSPAKNPPPYFFPDNNNRELFVSVKLTVYNALLGCSDSTKKYLRILDNCYIGVPTAFTPNGDGLNDYFWPHNALKAENLDFKVYNRWGQLVFHTNNWMQKWDGKINSVPQAADVYVWYLSYTHKITKQRVFQKGTVVLIR